MALGKQIKKYREKKGLTLEDLEEITGVKAGTIGALEVRDSSRSAYAPALAAGLGLTLDQLMDESRDWVDEADDLIPIKKPATLVPVVGIAMGGPDGYLSIDDHPAGEGELFVKWYSSDKNAYAVRVRGDSMRPRIKSGEFVVVEPNIQAQSGDDIVVKLLDGRSLVKELLWIRDGEMSLGSINNGVQPITLRLSDVDKYHRIAAIVPRGSSLIKGNENL